MSSSEEDSKQIKKKTKVVKKTKKRQEDDSTEESEFEYESDSDTGSDSDAVSVDSYFSYDSESVSGDEYEQEYENRSKKVSLEDLPESVRNAYIEKHKIWEEKMSHDKPTVTVSDPFKEGNIFNSYITYLLTSKGWNNTIDSSQLKYSVRRRYTDFEWLYYALLYRYPGILIDKLPPKKMMKNFDKEFVEERLFGLQRFIDNVCANIYLFNDNLFKDFVTLSDTEFYNLRGNNSKQSFYDFGLFKDAIVGDFKASTGFKTVVLHVRDTRPNEGLSRWNNYLRHLKAPVQVQQALRNLNDHISNNLKILGKIKTSLQGMIVDGTDLTNVTKQFRAGLTEYITLANENMTNIEKLGLKDETREHYSVLIDNTKELSSSVEVWYELQFFQPQEIIPELIYEFEKQIDNFTGLQELLSRHEAMILDYSRSWKIRDTQQFEMSQAKSNGERNKFQTLKKQFFDLDYQCKINKFVLQQISKAIIYCEYDKFINLRCDSLKKTVENFAHLQISIAQRYISRWKLLLKNINSKLDEELLDECEERVDYSCVYRMNDMSESGDKSNRSSQSSKSDVEK